MQKIIDNLVPALLILSFVLLAVMLVLLIPSDENNDCHLMLIPSWKVNIPICIPNE